MSLKIEELYKELWTHLEQWDKDDEYINEIRKLVKKLQVITYIKVGLKV